MANSINSDAQYSSTVPTSHASSQRERPKRRRSRGPDWDTFYKNGLPQEIIIIDDTPEPDAPAGPPHKKAVNGHAHVEPYRNGANTSASRQPAKKRKRDDEVSNAESAYYSQKYATSHASTPHVNGTGSLSTDRATVQTVAATSLSSNSQYDYDVQLGNKRKRTRQQVANEAKRREIEFLDAFIYKPPPFPPKKASEVNVRVVHDVSSIFLLSSLLSLALRVINMRRNTTNTLFSRRTTRASKWTTTTGTTLWFPMRTSPIGVSEAALAHLLSLCLCHLIPRLTRRLRD
jgi:hypothetical protein